ncbi:class I SAM-dependent DNA methyltransferase [Aliiroseovarius marinus]|uniref:class I SAM-dependent DNA methyltransferase n=1 Tax=Aliiroseovarius marinus TaxID=2500159 RepID=UPI003D7E6768
MQSISEFIERWKHSGGAERANYGLFLSELTEVLGVEKPLPVTDTGSNDHYRLERPVASAAIGETSKKYIDLYRRGSFILETKQGAHGKSAPSDQLSLPEIPTVKRVGHGVRGTRAWDKMMDKARGQADNYARGIAREDGWPPFIIVCDVGYVFEIYADFSGQGHGYTQFPDGNSFRVFLDDLEKPEIQELFQAIWNDPQSLDPSKTAAKVTREIADQLALLGRSFEKQGHEPDTVAAFLMRCLFSMFAEDVDLIPKESFTDLLKDMAQDPDNAAPALENLWQTMNTGGFSPILKTKVLRFNGGLFADAGALPLDSQQIALLIGAAQKDWKFVEPAIFGTLLERALDKRQRHKLGAHYTPRAYVERLVMPTVIEPLRRDWEDVRASTYALAEQGDMKKARDTVHAFHLKLADTRVLDPACGSGNFLYVALELMKRLEGEVTARLEELGEEQTALSLASFTVDPHNFLGIELNPWAARVAELVLWIGYLQWHFRTYGKAAPAEPVLRDFHNIENRDAVLDHGDTTPRMVDGAKVTRWDGITTKPHPVTGEEVPDDTARVDVLDYATPKPAQWPEADFIVGNPPFIGASRMRDALGDGYAEALWSAYPKMPKSADFVMFWWEKAAAKARAFNAKTGKGTRRFGFITTNSLRQTFNRKVLEPHLGDPKKPLSLIYAIPDHPWVDASMGAAVRIAMTVGRAGRHEGRLLTIAEEHKGQTEDEGRLVHFDEERGKIFANLRTGADVAGAKALKANEGISSPGVKLHGAGFIVNREEAKQLGLGTVDGLENHIREYRNGRDLTATPRGVMVIDLFGLTEAEVRQKYPAVYQHVLDKVKPERDQNNRETYRKNWWVFGEPRKDLRPAMKGLPRYIATVETSKHRVFQFLDENVLPDNMLIAIGLSDAACLSILSSRFHVAWALSSGGTLEDRPRYNKSRCFDPFPFPTLTEAQKTTLRALGEELDAHRKDRQAAHPKLTLTQMYNVLEKLRAGEAIEGKDKEIYEQGLIGLLKEIHDRIDAAVADAYGWPHDLSDDDILHRLVDLNAERAREEAAGKIRWLRPDYQNPTGASAAAKSGKLDLGDAPVDAKDKPAWPKTMPDQVAAVRDALAELSQATPEQIARSFKRGRASSVIPLLDSMTALGLAERMNDDTYRSTR